MPTLHFATSQVVTTLSNPLLKKSAIEIASLIHSGEVTSADVTRQQLEHAHSLNPTVNAYVSFRDELALAEAAKADEEIAAGNIRGPLHGVPMAIKDNLYVAGEKTTMASKIHADFVSDFDAAVVEKLRAAGVVLTGKLNMHEYAWGIDSNNPHFGAVHNPWNLDKIPGGSSGGSGAAVAADMSFTSLGTDTAGSIRIPSSICGLVGLKPTHGLVGKSGCFPLAWSLDHIGPMAKTVDDAAAVLQAIVGFDRNDPTSVDVQVGDYRAALDGDPSELVIGIEEDYFFHNVDAAVEERVRAGIDALAQQGATIKRVSIPSLKYSEWAEYITSLAEASAVHHKNLRTRPDDFGDDIRFLFELGEIIPATDYLRAQQVRRQIKKDFTSALEGVDVIIAPTLPVLPTDIGAEHALINGKEVDPIDNIIRFTGPSNLTGLPALTLPVGLADGLPVGLQIIGRAFDEATVLKVASQIEAADLMEGQRASVGA